MNYLESCRSGFKEYINNLDLNLKILIELYTSNFTKDFIQNQYTSLNFIINYTILNLSLYKLN